MDIKRLSDTGGRPTKRTPENRKKILEGLRRGLTRRLACQRARISESMFQSWLTHESENYMDEDGEVHNRFREDAEEAEASFADGLIDDVRGMIRKHAVNETSTFYDKDGQETGGCAKVIEKENPALALQLLERRFKKDFGKSLDITSGDQPVKAVIGFNLEEL